MKLKLLPILILISFFISCKKDSSVNNNPPAEQLPPETQEGKNTFGCLVNGKVWIPKASFPTIPLSASYQSNVFILQAFRNTDSTKEDIFFSRYFLAPIIFNLTSYTEGMTYRVLFQNPLKDTYFLNDTNHNGIMNITKVDTVSRIIAGNFYFDAIDTPTNTVAHISQGRFDIKY